MQFRLWHILFLMALILLAGVLSIQQLEAHVGRTTVPGLVIVDVPGLDASMAEAAVRRWPGALLQWAPADAAPLSPFGPDEVRALRSRGHAGALIRPREAAPPVDGSAPGGAVIPPAINDGVTPGTRDPDAGLHQAWGVLIRDVDVEQASASVADFVRGCDGVRPFIVGLQLQAPTVGELLSVVARQVDAAESLPGFRRTTVLVLGAREPQSQRRLVVRVDRGSIGRFPPPGLKDLLADTR